MCKIVIKAARAGKTHAAILESAATGATILCFNDAEADRVRICANHMGKKIPLPVSIGNFVSKTRGRSNRKYIVDNADMILEQFMNHPIEMITLTGSPLEAFKQNIKTVRGNKC